MKEKKVIQYYDSFSDNYDDFYEELQFKKYNLVLGEASKPTEWVLDHGGGTGLLSRWLNYPLLSIDISYPMILSGRNGNIYQNGIVGDMNHLPFRSNSIIAIFSFTSIQNSSDIGQSLNEIWRVSQDECKVFLTILKKKFVTTTILDWLDTRNIKYKLDENISEDVSLTFIISK